MLYAGHKFSSGCIQGRQSDGTFVIRKPNSKHRDYTLVVAHTSYDTWSLGIMMYHVTSKMRKFALQLKILLFLKAKCAVEVALIISKDVVCQQININNNDLSSMIHYIQKVGVLLDKDLYLCASVLQLLIQSKL